MNRSPTHQPMTERLIGAGLRTARSRALMTQERLSARIGLSFQQLGKYESGRNRISLSRFLEIANAIGAEPDALLRSIINDQPAILQLTKPE